MSYLKQLKNAMPVAPLKLLVLNSTAELVLIVLVLANQ